MNSNLLIIGASGHGKVVADAAEKMNYYNSIKFLDDNNEIHRCGIYQVIGDCNDVEKYVNNYDIFVAIGNANIRKKITERLIEIKAVIPVIIHPDAVIGTNVVIKEGTIVMAGSVINVDSKIGSGCIINTCSSIDHDCQIDNYVHISVGAHLAGNVKVGENTWIGIGTTISNNITVCDNCMIGAGTVVVNDIIEMGTYFGIPAKKKV